MNKEQIKKEYIGEFANPDNFKYLDIMADWWLQKISEIQQKTLQDIFFKLPHKTIQDIPGQWINIEDIMKYADDSGINI